MENNLKYRPNGIMDLEDYNNLLDRIEYLYFGVNNINIGNEGFAEKDETNNDKEG